MNKIVASIGIAAVGASTLQTASAQDTGVGSDKFWSVTATLRGFYDDNINGAPSGPLKEGSFGVELSPGVGLDWSNDQTSVDLGYRYSLRYFEKERFNTEGHDSHSHTFQAAINHAFSERYSLALRDTFVVGQEPDLLRSVHGGGAPLEPVPGDNIRNYASALFSATLTPVLGLELGYDNQWFDYEDSGDYDPGDLVPMASLSGLLDRVEQTFHVDALYRVAPSTTALFGYQFGVITYTADEIIAPAGDFLESEDKDSISHYVYGGVRHLFSPNLSGSAKLGARFIDYHRVNESSVSPYMQASLRYMYGPQNYLEGGASYDITMTPFAETRDARTANIYGTLRHQLASKLFGTATAQVQNLNYNGGNRDDDTIYTLGFNLEYAILSYLSAHVGYNFDAVESGNSNTDYQRNRVYIGVTAAY